MSANNTQDTQAIVLGLLNPGNDISEQELDDWLATEHIPTLLALAQPHVRTVRLLKAIDSQLPSRAALYDVTSAEDADRNPIPPSAKDKEVFSRVKSMQRLTYEHIATLSNDRVTPDTYFVALIWLTVKAEGEEELNKWFAEEHLPLLSKIPSYLIGRRYKLVSERSIGEEIEPAAKFLGVYEFTDSDFASTPEGYAANNTPWWTELQRNVVTNQKFRTFKVESLR